MGKKLIICGTVANEKYTQKIWVINLNIGSKLLQSSKKLIAQRSDNARRNI